MRSIALPAALLLAHPLACMAQSSPPQNRLDEVVVTANRVSRSADATLASVDVIVREDIARSGARSAADVLEGLSGVDLARNGGDGKSTSLFLRGTESDHVLVLIDGIRIGSATTGSAALQDIPASLIDRIEVVRGPRSSLYGSEAIGGVVQIFTRRGADGGFRPHAHLGAGNHHAFEIGAGARSGTDRGWLAVDASTRYTSGENACNGRPSPGGAGCFNFDFDHDGFRQNAASLSGGLALGDSGQVTAHWLETRGDNEFDGSTVNRAHTRQQSLGASAELRPAEGWRSRLSLGQSRDESDNYLDGDFRSRFDTRRDQIGWLNELALGDAQALTLGADWSRDRVAGTTAYAEDARSNVGVFGQWQLEQDAHRVDTSLRHDDNQQFGRRNTGNIAWGYLFPGQVRVTAAYGTAYKAPTFNELYFPNFGNPELRPERSRSVELGLAGGDSLRWRLAAYQTRISDLIAYDAALQAPDNIDRARIRGIELRADTRLAAWSLAGSLDWLDPRHLGSGANHGHLLPRRSRTHLRVDAGRDFGATRLDLTWRAAGPRYDDLANTRRLGGYATLDLALAHALDPAWTFKASLTNLFDKDYATAAFYNPPGRGLFFSIHYQL
ncbi:MAG: TonB-dependent vitamin B12 receptor [Rhodocyclaceae bacterium]|nr:TonB-dependent vitamin B12 receptor [Rhodocyclaceae bacterium]